MTKMVKIFSSKLHQRSVMSLYLCVQLSSAAFAQNQAQQADDLPARQQSNQTAKRQSASQQSSRQAAKQQSAKQQAGRQQVKQRNTMTQKAQSQGQSQGKAKRYAASELPPDDTASNKQVRQFHEVLNDLLTEFSYDVKQGQINGMKNIAIRKVSVSDALPSTYEQYVELLVTERIRENARVRMINCIPCKTKSSTLVDGKLMISSPTTSVQRMDEAAQQLNIENFMDVILVYHTTHMVLAFSVFNTTTKEEVWSRTYNSETLRSRYQKLAVDMSQIEKSRTSTEYTPEYKILVGIGGSRLPNVAGEERDKSFIGVHVRAAEKFDNRHVDFGVLTSLWVNTSSFLKAYPSEGTTDESATTSYDGEARPVAYKYVLGLHALYARNFIGDVESYDRLRHGAHVGLGAIISTGYLAPSLRAGWDMYFGRRWVLTFEGQYITDSTILVGSKYQKAKGGAGGDLTLSLNL